MYRLATTISQLLSLVFVLPLLFLSRVDARDHSSFHYALQRNSVAWFSEDDPSKLVFAFTDTTVTMHVDIAIAGIATNNSDQVLGVGVGLEQQVYVFRADTTGVEILLEREQQLPRGIGMWQVDNARYGLELREDNIDILARYSGEVHRIGTVHSHIHNLQPLDSTTVVVSTGDSTFLVSSEGVTALLAESTVLQRRGDTIVGVGASGQLRLLADENGTTVDTLASPGLFWTLVATNSSVDVFEPAEPWRTITHVANIGPQIRVVFANGSVYDHYGSYTLPLAVALLIVLAAYNWRRISKNRQRPVGKAWK